MTWFARESSRREREALLDYWDDVIVQSPTTPMPPPNVPAELGELIRAVHTADAASHDHPAFEDHLLRSLLARQKEIASMNPMPATAPPLSMPRNPVRATKADRRAGSLGRYALPAFEIALVVLLILASAAGIWLVDREQPRIVAPPVSTPVEATLDVPMYRGDPERTGVMPGPSIHGDPAQLWRVQVDGEIQSAPAIVDGILYFGAGDGGVYAVDAGTGEEIWRYQAVSGISSSPAVIMGVVYIGSEDGTLYALNAADGGGLWTVTGLQANASPVVVGNALYVGDEDGYLRALDTATGEEFWRAPLNAAADRSPAVADGVVYQGSSDGVLHTFDAITGEPGWALKLDGDGTITTTVVSGGAVYQGTFGGAENHFLALDATTGDELWRFDSDSGSGFYPAAVGGKTVYTPASDGIVYALDAGTGAEQWRFETGGQINAAPALVGETLYVANNDGLLFALDVATGAEQWRFTVEGEPHFGPVLTGGVAYLGTGFGYLYAIGGTGEELPATPGVGPIATPANPAATPVDVAPSIEASPSDDQDAVAMTPATTAVASPEAVEPSVAEFVWQVGQDEALLDRPEGLAIAPDGTLWVVDGGSRQIVQYNLDGSVIGSWDGADLGVENFLPASSDGSTYGAIGFDQASNVYVLDSGNHRVLVFSPEMELLREWGSLGEGEGQFILATDLVLDSEGNVYVLDVMLPRVQKFAPDGEFQSTIIGPDRGEYQLTALAGLGIGPDDTLYVPDASHVNVFAADGAFLGAFGEGTLGFAIDSAADTDGNVYVSDNQQNQIQIYNRDGMLIGSWGSFGRQPGQMVGLTMLAVDAQRHVYVIDSANGRVQKFAVDLPITGEATPEATPVAP